MKINIDIYILFVLLAIVAIIMVHMLSNLKESVNTLKQENESLKHKLELFETNTMDTLYKRSKLPMYSLDTIYIIKN
jgi:flagellar basal body-associated protein FliL